MFEPYLKPCSLRKPYQDKKCLTIQFSEPLLHHLKFYHNLYFAQYQSFPVTKHEPEAAVQQGE